MKLPITAISKKANPVVRSFFLSGTVKNSVIKSTLRLPDLKARACLRPELKPRGSGSTLSRVSLPRLQRWGLALSNGSIWIILPIVLFFLFSYASAQQKPSESGDAEFYNNRGMAYMDKGQYDQAISDYNKALEINPKFAEAYYNRGIACGGKGHFDQAISSFNKALEINQKFAEAYSNRGITYRRKGQYDQAISDYNKALEISPRYAEAYNNRGNAYGDKGQYDQAISDYNKALEISPRFAEVYSNRGRAYYLKGEYGKCWEDIKKAQGLGYKIPPKFLDDLRKASGKQN